MGARNQLRAGQPVRLPAAPADALRLLQDDWRVSPALTVNLGAALRVRDAAVGGQQQPDQLRSGDAHAAAGDATARSTIARSSTWTRTTGRPAHRRGLQPQRQDGAARGLRHELRAVQSSRRREPAVVQRSARRADRRSRSSRRRGSASANQAPTTCFRPTQMGYPDGLNVPANFNPINGRVNYIPPDNEHRQHPELARHGAA